MQLTIDPKSGVPFYRQIIDQIQFAIADGRLSCGDRLPTVRQLAEELEIKGVVSTQMGTGTFIGNEKVEISELERKRMLDQICTELLSRAASYGLTLDEVLAGLHNRGQERRPPS